MLKSILFYTKQSVTHTSTQADKRKKKTQRRQKTMKAFKILKQNNKRKVKKKIGKQRRTKALNTTFFKQNYGNNFQNEEKNRSETRVRGEFVVLLICQKQESLLEI